MTDHMEDLVDYEEEPIETPATASSTAVATGGLASAGPASTAAPTKGSYVGQRTSGFKDFLLKPELQKSINEAGFEHPSEVQQNAIPQAVMGSDIVCQAKSGMGKTCVFGRCLSA